MIPRDFEYHAPKSIPDALGLLAQLGAEAKLLAGGHSLLPMMKMRFAQPGHLIDLGRIAELKGIREDAGTIRIGAMTTENELIWSQLLQQRCPLLVEGARLISDPQVRYKGTIGGDIAHAAMYEWNYQRQLLAIKLLEHDDRAMALKEQDIFSARYLLKRPLLEAISCVESPVLLIDEVDRADEAFEAFLLELLSDFQMSIPELGTVQAVSRPLVIITSNGTRELSDALRRRCLYQYIDYPTFEKELAIVEIRAPGAQGQLARQLVEFVQAVRRMDLQKKPGIAETLDWTAALLRLGITTIDDDGAERILDTLSALIKTRGDRAGFTRDVVARIAATC